ncbi:VUT family protein [Rhodovastum atsumiense]|uniref:VUT family protein n=1 Tax=Rhodovastum atsumiense TaxID=504468 RepID=UPI0020240949|nr:VUT family protein [Rhodovastum atsumiense]
MPPRRVLPATRIGLVAFVLFLACIPLANWMIGHVGLVCLPQGPCLVPVAPGLMAPSGVLIIGFALVLRDMVQRCLGTGWGLGAVLAGSVASVALADPHVVLASGLAFLLSELTDFAVYTPLQRRGLVLAVVASSLAGLVVDSVVFLSVAFGSLDFLAGQVIGKAWAVAISVPLVRLARRLGPQPA